MGYFHLVFTLPHELNRLILVNKKPLINILFHAVSETLLEFAQTHLKAILGITASCIPGIKLSWIIFISIVRSPPELCRSIKSAGVLPAKTFSFLLQP